MSLEPIQTNDDNHNVDETEVSNNGDKVDIQLLVSLEGFHINTERGRLAVSDKDKRRRPLRQNARIQTRLGRRAGTEKVGIDRSEVTVGVQDRQGKQTHEDDPCI